MKIGVSVGQRAGLPVAARVERLRERARRRAEVLAHLNKIARTGAGRGAAASANLDAGPLERE